MSLKTAKDYKYKIRKTNKLSNNLPIMSVGYVTKHVLI